MKKSVLFSLHLYRFYLHLYFSTLPCFLLWESLCFTNISAIFFFQPYLRRSLEQNIRFMVHDTCKYLIMIVFSLLCIGAFGFWYHAGYNGIYLIHPRKVFHPLSIVGIILLVPGTQCLSTIWSLSQPRCFRSG